MHGWSLVPGLALIAAGFVIQFGSYLRRPRPVGWILTGVRLRFVGIGALFLGIGLDTLISALLTGLPIGLLLLGIVMIGFAGTWFYAASDKIFRGH